MLQLRLEAVRPKNCRQTERRGNEEDFDIGDEVTPDAPISSNNVREVRGPKEDTPSIAS